MLPGVFNSAFARKRKSAAHCLQCARDQKERKFESNCNCGTGGSADDRPVRKLFLQKASSAIEGVFIFLLVEILSKGSGGAKLPQLVGCRRQTKVMLEYIPSHSLLCNELPGVDRERSTLVNDLLFFHEHVRPGPVDQFR